MGNHFREPDTFVQFTPETRNQIEKAIEGLFGLLDQCDGNSDFEDGGDNEPLLASAAAQDKSGAFHDDGYVRELDDCDDEKGGDDEETGDDEPLHSISAVHWQTNGDLYAWGSDLEA
jgi:hypothetical protein